MSKSKGKFQRYTPVLKWKRGEMWALKHLNSESKDKIVPLLDFLPHTSKTIPDHADEQSKRLLDAWGARPAFIDTFYVGTQTPASANDHENVFKALQARGCEAVPVTALGRSPHFQQSVRKCIGIGENGVLIRLGVSDFSDISQLALALNNLTNFLGVQKSDVDILVDYSTVASCDIVIQLMRLHINNLPSINQWRSLTVASGCFPSSLKPLGAGHWHLIQRAEWLAWEAARSGTPALARRPYYADYGIRDPGPPPEFGRASANLRYTTDSNYLVRLGGLVNDGGAQQMHAMCGSLIARPEYKGSTFSSGDAAIATTAASSDSSGGPQQWVQWCMNHHFEFVVEQLGLLPAA